MYVAVSLEKRSKFITFNNWVFGETADIHKAMKISEDEDSFKIDYLLKKIRQIKSNKNWVLVKVSSRMFGTGYDKPVDLSKLTIARVLEDYIGTLHATEALASNG